MKKQRVLQIGLLLFALWPLAHVYLVMRFNLSAWKLGGWGMYATPRPSFSGITVSGRRSSSQEFEEVHSIPPRVEAEAKQFLERQRWLGQLVRPDDLAHLLKQQMPQFAELRIMVYTPVLDRQTAMIVMRPATYEYPAMRRSDP